MHEPWAQVFTPENQSTEQAQRPASHAKLAASVDFKGTPFVDAKMVQIQQFLNKGLKKNNWPKVLEF